MLPVWMGFEFAIWSYFFQFHLKVYFSQKQQVKQVTFVYPNTGTV